jgi:hypothetical protein
MIILPRPTKDVFNKNKTKEEIIEHIHTNMPEWKIFLDIPYSELMIMRFLEKETLQELGSPWSTSAHKKRKKYQLVCVLHILSEQEEVDPVAQSFWDTLGVNVYKVSKLSDFLYDIKDMRKEYEF